MPRQLKSLLRSRRSSRKACVHLRPPTPVLPRFTVSVHQHRIQRRGSRAAAGRGERLASPWGGRPRRNVGIEERSVRSSVARGGGAWPVERAKRTERVVPRHGPGGCHFPGCRHAHTGTPPGAVSAGWGTVRHENRTPGAVSPEGVAEDTAARPRALRARSVPGASSFGSFGGLANAALLSFLDAVRANRLRMRGGPIPRQQ